MASALLPFGITAALAGVLYLRATGRARARAAAPPPPPPLRIGVLGTAAIAAKSAKAIAASGSVVAAIGSRSAAKAEAWARAHAPAAARHASYEALLADASLAAVYIPLPCALHAEWVAKAAAAGKGVLCEKPAAVSLAELEAMVLACRAHSVPFLDGTMFHWHAREREMEAHLRSPAFGAIERVNASFSFRGDDAFRAGNIRMDPALEPMGCLGDLGQYCIRFGLWAYAWEMPASVRAVAHARNAQGVPTHTSCEFVWPSGGPEGGPRVLHADNSFSVALRQHAEVCGTQAFLRLEDFVISRSHAACEYQVTRSPGLDADHSAVTGATARAVVAGCNQEAAMWAAFAAAARAPRFVPEWAQRALKVQACLDAAMRSMAAGGAETPVVASTALAGGGHAGCAGADCPCGAPEPPRRRAPPVPPQLRPLPRELAPGEAAWLCTCGESRTFPACDGSHKAYNAANGTSFKPSKLENTSDKSAVFYLWCVARVLQQQQQRARPPTRHQRSPLTHARAHSLHPRAPR
jgi:predicted dehydrogenase/CDGSH-type Zn-finger protein